ncbi:hypothetical protein CYMTET_53027 [Cymbomonas tetramitiformis]|uniref:Uncharacterized protein n=1 Tax=Cymbomonas tetramitiformis TaxID=36881 RepID=A0AAE0EQ78_9CHLO|nr:hypothetical protein CYMTET_53027 [Cymbomonas tetramitiformis]
MEGSQGTDDRKTVSEYERHMAALSRAQDQYEELSNQVKRVSAARYESVRQHEAARELVRTAERAFQYAQKQAVQVLQKMDNLVASGGAEGLVDEELRAAQKQLLETRSALTQVKEIASFKHHKADEYLRQQEAELDQSLAQTEHKRLAVAHHPPPLPALSAPEEALERVGTQEIAEKGVLLNDRSKGEVAAIARAQQQVAELRTELATEERKRTLLELDVRQLQGSLAGAKEHARKAEFYAGEQHLLAKTWEFEFEKSSHTIKALQNHTNVLQANMKNSEIRISEMTTFADKHVSSKQEEMGTLNDQIELGKTMQSDLLDHIEELKEEVASAELRQESHNAEMRQKKAEFSLKEHLLREELARAEERVQQAQQSLVDSKAREAAKQTALAQSEEVLQVKDANIARLIKAQEVTQNAYDEMCAKLNLEQHQIRNLNSEARSSAQEMAASTAEAERVGVAFAAAGALNAQMEKDLAARNAELEEMREALGAAVAKRTATHEDLKALRAEKLDIEERLIPQLQADVAAKELQLEAAELNISTLLAELSEAREHEEVLTKEVTDTKQLLRTSQRLDQENQQKAETAKAELRQQLAEREKQHENLRSDAAFTELRLQQILAEKNRQTERVVGRSGLTGGGAGFCGDGHAQGEKWTDWWRRASARRRSRAGEKVLQTEVEAQRVQLLEQRDRHDAEKGRLEEQLGEKSRRLVELVTDGQSDLKREHQAHTKGLREDLANTKLALGGALQSSLLSAQTRELLLGKQIKELERRHADATDQSHKQSSMLLLHSLKTAAEEAEEEKERDVQEARAQASQSAAVVLGQIVKHRDHQADEHCQELEGLMGQKEALEDALRDLTAAKAQQTAKLELDLSQTAEALHQAQAVAAFRQEELATSMREMEEILCLKETQDLKHRAEVAQMNQHLVAAKTSLEVFKQDATKRTAERLMRELKDLPAAPDVLPSVDQLMRMVAVQQIAEVEVKYQAQVEEADSAREKLREEQVGFTRLRMEAQQRVQEAETHSKHVRAQLIRTEADDRVRAAEMEIARLRVELDEARDKHYRKPGVFL